MAATALSALLAKACLALLIACLAAPASAQYASASAAPQDTPGWLPDWKMALEVQTDEIAPFTASFDVVPLTPTAGLRQTDSSKQLSVGGDLITVGYSNFSRTSYLDKVVFFCCDANSTDSPTNLLQPNDMLNFIMNNSTTPNAILLYSTVKPVCLLDGDGDNLPYQNVWTMTTQDDALKIHTVIAASTTTTDPVIASITPSRDVDNQPPRPGSTSTIAMSILYSITGLITLLFLFIIGTGAVRAHRNPERYGPRASANGRPRRSRARGLAMAMLETLPIVKFGENDQRKPDEENALENTQRAAEPQPQDASQVMTGAVSHSDAAPEPSEAASNPTAQPDVEGAPAPTSSTTDKAKKEPEPAEENPGCSICTEDFTVGEDVRVLPCNHKYHPACVDPWLVNVSGTCPLCRLDLRPPEDTEHEENDEAAAPEHATTTADGHLAPPPAEGEQAAAGEATQRRRRSRLLDWNRLRHASVDERLQALRQYRQSQEGSDPSGTADDERRHSRLSNRLRERFHIRGESRSSATTTTTTAPREESLPAVQTVQH
ncbi:hypothetical protein F5Y10DRAFT_144207 [Nemania abortiva]|nr:hypothetical protein F5Y10DRAFT_144207 [Nemania abortiva]